MPDLSPALASLADAASAIARAASGAAATASDDSLLAFQRQVAASARLLEQAAATFAAEIAFRSRRELGYDGLAQRRGECARRRLSCSRSRVRVRSPRDAS